MSNNTINMKVKKTGEKTRTACSEAKKDQPKKVRKVNTNLALTPANDEGSKYAGVPDAEVKVPAPQDGTTPTWRTATGKVMPMVKVTNEDGSIHYRPRGKKGPAAGKKYRPRAAKIAQMMSMGDLNNGIVTQKGLQHANSCIMGFSMLANLDTSMAKLAQENATKTTAEVAKKADPQEKEETAEEKADREQDVSDYQTLVQAFQMRSMGAIDDAQFLQIKDTIFEDRKLRKERAGQLLVSQEAETPALEEAVEATVAADDIEMTN